MSLFWAIKNPSGKILLRTISPTRYAAIRSMGCEKDSWMWKRAISEGYRAVKIEITEVEK